MNARPAFRGARVPRNGRAIEAGRGASRRALGAVLALAALVLSLAPGAAVAAPEAKILRIDPRAAQTEGAPILTTLIDLSQTKKADEVTRTCNALSGDARFDCVSAELDKPGAVYSSFDFPERNALFTVDIDRQDFPATFESKARWGDKLGQPLIGTAWVIMVDAAATMGPRFDEAKAVASAFINALGPQDIVIVKLFNDRGVVQDSGWTNQKQKAQGTLDAVATTYKGGRARALGTIIQNGVTDSFKELGNVGVNVQIPLHQAVVVLSNGTAGADATSTANHALLMRKYMNGGRFPEDNTALPKTPVPLISIWFPNKEYEEFYETAQGFMENLANTEAGGYFNIVRDRQAQRAASIVNAVRTRFNKMWIVRWRLSCVATSVTQSFKLVFANTTPLMLGDATFQNVPLAFDPTTWPLDIDKEATEREAQKNPVYPGGTVRVIGNFCWGGNAQRAELYMVPSNQAAPTAVQGGSIEDAKKAQKTLIEAGMRGRVISAGDQFVEFEVPKTDKFLVGKAENMTARLIVYDNQAKRTSPVTADKIVTLKAKEAPLPILLIGAATFGGVVVILLLVSIARGGGRKGRSGTAPPAPRPIAAPAPAPMAFAPAPAPMPMPGPAPMHGGHDMGGGFGGGPPIAASRATLSGAQGIFTVTPGIEMKAGRDGAVCQILLSEPRVSGAHATVKLEAGQLLVRDDGSNNGTFVNGQRVPPHVFTPVPQGAQLRFGPVEFAVRLE